MFHRDLIIKLAARYKLPAVYSRRLYVADGGLVSYGSDIRDQFRRAAGYGVLMQYTESDQEGQIGARALLQGLQKLGWKVGHNLQIDHRWAGGDRDRFRLHAAELVKLKSEIVVAVSTPAVKALQRELVTLPIVFTQVSDPLGQDIVKSLAQPGGAVTGFANYDRAMGGKWLELLKEVAPALTSAVVVFNPQTAPYTDLYMRSIEAAARSAAVNIVAFQVHNDAEIERCHHIDGARARRRSNCDDRSAFHLRSP